MVMGDVQRPSLAYFYIADQLFPYDPNERLYTMAKPNELEEDNDTCPCCRKHNFDPIKGIFERKQCNYCPFDYCSNCCYKTKLFPWGLRDDDGDRPRGKICKRCDHKFWIRDLFTEANRLMDLAEARE